MTALDWIIIAFVALMALWGYAQGLVVSALSLAGFAGGAFVGSRLAPLLLDQGSSSPYAPLFSLVTALMVGGLAAILLRGAGRGDQAAAVVSARPTCSTASAARCWSRRSGWRWSGSRARSPSRRRARASSARTSSARRSSRKLNEALPPSGPILNALARVDPFPRIRGPAANVPRPEPAHPARPRRAGGARRASCEILGTACGLAVQGSGWVARPGVVVTNAHVVAGEDDTTVQTGRRRRLGREGDRLRPAQRRRRAARRRARCAGPRPAHGRARRARRSRSSAIRRTAPTAPSPGRLGETRTVISRDAYGTGPVRGA